MASSMAGWVPYMFRDVSPAWRALLLGERTKPLFRKALESLDGRLAGVPEAQVPRALRPHPAMVLEACRYAEPTQIRVVIVGQDPYTHSHEACGLSFSVPRGVAVPPSLRNVYGACAGGTPKHGDLRSWATQGVLLLNRYLTRSPVYELREGTVRVVTDKNDDLHDFWEPYTEALLREVLAVSPRCCIMLWGKPAQELLTLEDAFPQHKFLTYSHPSPLARTPFKNCDHFAVADALVGRTRWDYMAEPDVPGGALVVASDGGCNGNGRADARAVAATFVPETYPGGNRLRGVVPAEWTHRLGNERWCWEDSRAVCRPGTNTPTSARAELVGLLKALEWVVSWYKLRPGRQCPVHLLLDATYAINAIQYLVYKAEAAKKNDDLISAIREAARELSGYLPASTVPDDWLQQRLIHPAHRKWDSILESEGPAPEYWSGITAFHVTSHQPEPRDKGSPHWCRWAANRRADELADAGK